MHKNPAIILSKIPEIHIVLGLVREVLNRAGLAKFSADQNTEESILVLGPFAGFTITEDFWHAKSHYFSAYPDLLPEDTKPDHFLPSLSITVPATPGAQWAQSLIQHHLATSLAGILATPTGNDTYSLALPYLTSLVTYDRWIHVTNNKPGVFARISRACHRQARPRQVLQ